MLPATSVLARDLATAASAERIRERAAAVLRAAEYQGTLPLEPKAFRFDLSMVPFGLVLRLLAAAAAAILVVLAITWLVRRLGFRTDERERPLEEPTDAVIARVAGGTAQRLAAEGRFAEAVHVLLLETLEVLSRVARLAPSLTSREVVARVPLVPTAREALKGLVAAVEISYFGSATAGEPEYRECLARFHSFLDSYRTAP